jgi:hypothetical protein
MLILMIAAATLVEFVAAFYFYFAGEVLRGIFWLLAAALTAVLAKIVGDLQQHW